MPSHLREMILALRTCVHWIDLIVFPRIIRILYVPSHTSATKSCVHFGIFSYVFVGVCSHFISVLIELARSVGVELGQANREQLDHLQSRK
jgi:hypothetical protein